MRKFKDMTDGLNAPQFPGQQVKGLTIEQIRTLVKKQQRVKGYAYSVTTGTTTNNIQLSGTARIFLGLALIPRNPGNPIQSMGFQRIATVTLKINNEIIIQDVDPNFLSAMFNTDEYYYLPRPLSGTDEITISFTNPGATELANLIIYYI